jgi:hypothetical protein
LNSTQLDITIKTKKIASLLITKKQKIKIKEKNGFC